MPPSVEIDHDTQLALLASLLEPATYPVTELSDALKNSKGDVAAAAEALLLPRVKSAGKRKAGSSLESWLGRKRGGAAATAAATSKRDRAVVKAEGDGHDDPRADHDGREARMDRPSSPPTNGLPEPFPDKKPDSAHVPSPSKQPLKNAYSLLHPSPSSSSISTKRKSAPQPAIPLATQSAISAHSLPLTLLKSPLSPALASALYLALMEDSEAWGKHQWFLAGRWVESPHTSANYYRVGGGYGESGESEEGERDDVVQEGRDEGQGIGLGRQEQDGDILEHGRGVVHGSKDNGRSEQGARIQRANGFGTPKAGSGTSEEADTSEGSEKPGEKDKSKGKYYYSGSELFPPKVNHPYTSSSSPFPLVACHLLHPDR